MIDTQSARSEILARIRSVTRRDGGAEHSEQISEEISRDYLQAGALPVSERIDLLSERLRDYGAGVYSSTFSQLAATIAEILHSRNKKSIVVPPDIDPAWLSNDGDGCTFVADNGLSYAEIEACDGVLTGCTVAIAGTGTLGLCHGPRGYALNHDRPGQGRRALTLIPDYHLCVVRASDVVETVPEGLRLLEPYKLQPITLISGPSATADIEMTRIQGVHGPRVLDVILAG